MEILRNYDNPTFTQIAKRFVDLEEVYDSINYFISAYTYSGCNLDFGDFEIDVVDSLVYFAIAEPHYSQFEKYEIFINGIPTRYNYGKFKIPYTDILNIEFYEISLELGKDSIFIDTTLIQRILDVNNIL